MKRFSCLLMCLCFSVGFAQDWMTSLDVGGRLAITQDKLMLVVWENTYFEGAPVYVETGEERPIFVKDMFLEPVLDSLVWKHFVPVILPENEYSERFESIRSKRSTQYLDKFSDGSFKIMDANGNILNVNSDNFVVNLSRLIDKYGVNMSFLKTELRNYTNEQNFYTSFYLASKYMDFAYFSSPRLRQELVGLAAIYLEEASNFVSEEPKENQFGLNQRVELLEIQEDIILGQPKKASRKLRRIDLEDLEKGNVSLYTFLNFSANVLLQDNEEAAKYESQVRTVDKRKLQAFINKKTVQ